MFLPIELSYSFAESKTKVYDINKLTEDLFGDVKIVKSEILYNYDDSSDYIYLEFKDNGYAIFLRETMELMEYSPQGSINFPDNDSIHYYGGPGSYLKKQDGIFVDLFTQEKYYISEENAKLSANNIRKNLMKNFNSREQKEQVKLEDITDNNLNLMSVETDGPKTTSSNEHLKNKNFIANFQYFMKDPTHGRNSTGTYCAVAAQLLLSYHNYYSDRRIIENKYLNGNDGSDAENNPNFCNDPMEMTSRTLGTRGILESDDYDIQNYFAYVVKNIPPSSSLSNIKDGISNILNERGKELGEHIDYSITLKYDKSFLGIEFPVDINEVKSEINLGRPVIVSIEKDANDEDDKRHAAVAYGYCDYVYPESSDTYWGFITSYGWTGAVDVWVNSSWCDGYVSLKINHTHNYYSVREIDSIRKEYKCSECGHRTDAAIEMNCLDRYAERVAFIPQNSYTYKDYYVKFATAGNKLFQTFGAEDVKMYLYDNEYRQLAYNDDSGYKMNALFNYTVEKDKPYILRVQFFSSTDSSGEIKQGRIKIGITPASETYSNYDNIEKLESVNWCMACDVPLNSTKVMCVIPQPNEWYQFYTMPFDIDDAYLYLVDPLSTDFCIYDDDSAGDHQARIQTHLLEDRNYLIILAAFNIASQSGTVGFCMGCERAQ